MIYQREFVSLMMFCPSSLAFYKPQTTPFPYSHHNISYTVVFRFMHIILRSPHLVHFASNSRSRAQILPLLPLLPTIQNSCQHRRQRNLSSDAVGCQKYRHGMHATSQTLLVSTVLPDPTASAAGTRTQRLLDGLSKISRVHLTSSVKESKDNAGKDPLAASSQAILDNLTIRGISWSRLPPNRTKEIESLTDEYPQVDRIVFDRFYTEEMFSFAFQKKYPHAALVLDMQDMHSLRGGRERLVKSWDATYAKDDPFGVLPQVMQYVPSIDSNQLLRELGSIHRSDLTLVCSPHEMKLLTNMHSIDESKLCLAPFFVTQEEIKPISSSTSLPSEPSFVFCGGFKHEPNVDAVRLLLHVIWSKIHRSLPNAKLYIHGAYCPAEIRQFHNPENTGVQIQGYTKRIEDVFRPGTVLLAPLRFGAGIKGKIIDAWSFGVPVVTTPVGSEGLVCSMENITASNTLFGGKVSSSIEGFVESAVRLGTDSGGYFDAASHGQNILRLSQDGKTNWQEIERALARCERNLSSRRQNDFTRALLWHHNSRSTEFFSRWIELKEESTSTQATRDQ